MRTPTVMAVLLFTTPTLLARADEPSKGEKYALLVGVQKYSEAKELRPLPFAERDVTDLAAALRDGGYKADNVVVMTETAAADDLRFLPMKKRILKELRMLLAGRAEGDTVLVALSGHGVHFSGDKGSYFCPADAELDDRSTLLSVADLYAEVEASKAGVKVLLVDACRNDPFQDASKAARADLASVTRPEVPEPPGGVVAFFSCSEKEKAYEDKDLGHGVFFHYVIEGLKGGAASDDGDVTVLGLSAYVTRKVGDHVRATYGATQQPELMGRSSGAAKVVSRVGRERPGDKGDELLAAHRNKEAIDYFTDAIRRNPNDDTAYARRAQAYLGRLCYGEAREDSKKALGLNAKSALALAVHAGCIGSVAWKDQAAAAEQAVADCTEALRLDPGLILAYANRAGAYAIKGDFKSASADAETAIRMGPKCTIGYLARGSLRDRNTQLGDSISDYTEAIRLDAKDANAYYLRGSAYCRRMDFLMYFADSATAVNLDPDNVAYLCGRAWASQALHDYDRAIDDAKLALRLDPNCNYARFVLTQCYRSRAEVLKDKGQTDLAIADCTEAVRFETMDGLRYSNYALRALMYEKKGEHDRAIADYTEAIRTVPKDASAYLRAGHYCLRAYVYAAKGEHNQAIADYTEAIRIDPTNWINWTSRSNEYRAMGDEERAKADADQSNAIRNIK